MDPEQVKELAMNVVLDVIDDLMGRGGFDDWWDSLDEDTAQEVVADLRDVVVSVLRDAGVGAE